MKCAYEAAHGVEAHMIANLLEQQHILARIDGEHLTSGMGDLPVAGLVRVMVNDDSYDEARRIIREWEASSPPPATEAAPTNRLSAAGWFVLGMIAGMILMSWIAATT